MLVFRGAGRRQSLLIPKLQSSTRPLKRFRASPASTRSSLHSGTARIRASLQFPGAFERSRDLKPMQYVRRLPGVLHAFPEVNYGSPRGCITVALETRDRLTCSEPSP